MNPNRILTVVALLSAIVLLGTASAVKPVHQLDGNTNIDYGPVFDSGYLDQYTFDQLTMQGNNMNWIGGISVNSPDPSLKTTDIKYIQMGAISLEPPLPPFLQEGFPMPWEKSV